MKALTDSLKYPTHDNTGSLDHQGLAGTDEPPNFIGNFEGDLREWVLRNLCSKPSRVTE